MKKLNYKAIILYILFTFFLVLVSTIAFFKTNEIIYQHLATLIGVWGLISIPLLFIKLIKMESEEVKRK